MASTYSAMPIEGVSFSRRTLVPDFQLGTPTIGNQADTWLYVHAAAIVAVGTCTVNAGFEVVDAAGLYTADTAFAAGEYGWVRLTDSPLMNPDVV